MNQNASSFEGLRTTPGRRLVLFYGAACAPCARLKPRLEALALRAGLALHQINVAGDMDAARALGIRAVPTVVAIREGQTQVLFTGEISDEQILRKIEEAGLLP